VSRVTTSNFDNGTPRLTLIFGLGSDGKMWSVDLMKPRVGFRRLRQALEVRWAERTGDLPSVRDQLAALLLPVRERVLGPEHPGTLAARSSLACWTGTAGDPARACDQLAALLLPVRERVHGPEHPDTQKARSNLARWSGQAG
jgi:hypothetical protein